MVAHIGRAAAVDRTGLAEADHTGPAVVVVRTGLVVEEDRRIADLVEVVVDPVSQRIVSQCSSLLE